jgi:hypothetical protein
VIVLAVKYIRTTRIQRDEYIAERSKLTGS